MSEFISSKATKCVGLGTVFYYCNACGIYWTCPPPRSNESKCGDVELPPSEFGAIGTNDNITILTLGHLDTSLSL